MLYAGLERLLVGVRGCRGLTFWAGRWWAGEALRGASVVGKVLGLVEAENLFAGIPLVSRSSRVRVCLGVDSGKESLSFSLLQNLGPGVSGPD
jgi:hypothetical protein